MNKAELVNLSGHFEADALRILRQVPGLTVTAEHPPGDGRADAIVCFAGTATPVAVEIKRRANAATAWQLVHHAAALADLPLLLIAQETTAEARDILRRHGIALIDALGNAHMQLPGLLLHLEGRRQRPPRDMASTLPTRLTGKAGMAAQALLLEPHRPWRVRDLAELTGISAGLAHRVLARLDAEGLLQADGVGPRRVRYLTDPGALLDLWAEETGDEVATRVNAYLLAPNPKALAQDLTTALERQATPHAITGAGAAARLAPLLTAVPVVDLWVTADIDANELCRQAGADPVAEGHNLALLQAKDDSPLAFRRKLDGVWLANTFRVYADLRRDPRRGREQADHLRQEVIGL